MQLGYNCISDMKLLHLECVPELKVLFLQGNERCETSYRDRAGKYMGQRGVTLPRL